VKVENSLVLNANLKETHLDASASCRHLKLYDGEIKHIISALSLDGCHLTAHSLFERIIEDISGLKIHPLKEVLIERYKLQLRRAVITSTRNSNPALICCDLGRRVAEWRAASRYFLPDAYCGVLWRLRWARNKTSSC
jgi:hypothetical protein